MKLKRLGLVFILLGLTITTVACSSENTTSPSAITSPQLSNESSQVTPSPTVKPSTSAQADLSSQVKPSTGSQPSSSSVEKTKFYYGTWIIKKYIPTTNVSSLSEKNINDYIGRKIVVDENKIETNQGIIKNPIFEEKTLTNDDLINGWKVQFSSLGITGNFVTQVEVSNYSHETRNGLGSDFFFTNINKTYTTIGGCFFELEK